ncbi:MAG: molybdate ABC transporter substrate-binding protein [Terrimicrobiaceae bacterium]
MKKTILLCLLGALLTSRADTITLTVSAAVSLKAPLETLKAEFEKTNPGLGILYNFGSSGSLQQQIVHGAPADVFISAAAKQMDDLERAGLVLSGSRFVLLANTIVLIAPAGSTGPGGFDGLTAESVKTIAIGEPKSVPVGMYAMEIFAHLGLEAGVKNKLVFAKDARQVLFYLESGNADAGIVYGSDAIGSKSVRIVATAPVGSHNKVEYPAAVIEASGNPGEATAFLDFLRSPWAEALFKSAGFDTKSSP